ncbi:MAG: diaminopimelate epimerase [Nocardioidaceae bacterium]|nr:MAG: diaminopimelate epimerase [Nocardioidaceae bacterium]
MTSGFAFLKGHGTHNDFVVLPDPDGSIHGSGQEDLDPELVRALCDRRGGIGADGVLRALRGDDGIWFMDYRNADGSVAEMCGNGIRVFARYLADYQGETSPLAIDTRAGRKTVIIDGDVITADLGSPEVLGEAKIAIGSQVWPATHINLGNPHAVAFLDGFGSDPNNDLSDLDLSNSPEHDQTIFPEGVNAEFVVRRGERHLAMRVYERGSGETRSCGTGACAVMVAAAIADGVGPGSSYRVDVPGGTLRITWTDDDRVLLAGPAVLVASGNWLA